MGQIPLVGITHVLTVVILGLITLVVAISFAIRPLEKKMGLIKPASMATVFFILSATVAGLATAFLNGAETSPPNSSLMIAGFAEAMIPAIGGFGLLGLSWTFTLIGLRRLG